MDFLYAELGSVNSLDDIVEALNELNSKVNNQGVEIEAINAELALKQDIIDEYLKAAELGDNNTLRLIDKDNHVLIYPQQ